MGGKFPTLLYNLSAVNHLTAWIQTLFKIVCHVSLCILFAEKRLCLPYARFPGRTISVEGTIENVMPSVKYGLANTWQYFSLFGKLVFLASIGYSEANIEVTLRGL